MRIEPYRSLALQSMTDWRYADNEKADILLSISLFFFPGLLTLFQFLIFLFFQIIKILSSMNMRNEGFSYIWNNHLPTMECCEIHAQLAAT